MGWGSGTGFTLPRCLENPISFFPAWVRLSKLEAASGINMASVPTRTSLSPGKSIGNPSSSEIKNVIGTTWTCFGSSAGKCSSCGSVKLRNSFFPAGFPGFFSGRRNIRRLGGKLRPLALTKFPVAKQGEPKYHSVNECF